VAVVKVWRLPLTRQHNHAVAAGATTPAVLKIDGFHYQHCSLFFSLFSLKQHQLWHAGG